MRILALAAILLVSLSLSAADRLTSKPAAKIEAPVLLKVGDEVVTGANERRRVRLEDGGVLFVNAGSRVKAVAAGQIEVRAGEVYADVERPIRITAAGRDIRADKASLAVRIDKVSSSVAVTRGQAVIGEGVNIAAGWQVTGERHKTPIQRASHLLDWTKDLHAESPLVPASNFAGGSLLAKDVDGQEAKIALRKFHVDVHIEDGFARTTIDQTYFNHESTQLEGQFYFPLPPDASLSYFAMYVDGNRMEAGMVERERGRNIYETIRHANRDPALLEWVDGSTFKMRVFPLEARTEKRILLSYTQRLGSLYGQTQYRFPAGHSLQSVEQWSFQATVKDGAALSWSSPSHDMKATAAGDLTLRAEAKKARTDRDVVLNLSGAADASNDSPRFSSVKHEGAEYLLMRYRPQLEAAAERPQRRWLILCETSGDRDPLLARTQIEIVRNLLHQAEPGDTFLLATAATRVRLHSDRAVSLTSANVEAGLKFLENAHLVGALDLSAALGALAPHVADMGETMLVHVGSGVAAMGSADTQTLVKRLPARTQYVGVGVGRRWNRAFMKAAAEASGGYFTQINPDEPIAWRTFDLSATLNTPRLLHVTAESVDANGPAFLSFQETLAQGEELAAITRAGPPLPGMKEAKATTLPSKIRVLGTLAGQPFERVFDVKNPTANAGYLPRTWAKLEIDRLLALHAHKHREPIVALSKSLYVMSPFTSMLVLEHDDLYTQYKVDRDRRDHWAAYASPAKIDVVYEPEAGQPDPKRAGQKPQAKEVAKTVTVRESPRLMMSDREIIDGFRGVPPNGRQARIGSIYVIGGSAKQSLSDVLNSSSLLYPKEGSPTSERKRIVDDSVDMGSLTVRIADTATGPFLRLGGVYSNIGLVGQFAVAEANLARSGLFAAAAETPGLANGEYRSWRNASPVFSAFDSSNAGGIRFNKRRLDDSDLELRRSLQSFSNGQPPADEDRDVRPLATGGMEMFEVHDPLSLPALAPIPASARLHTSITGGLLGRKLRVIADDRIYFDLLTYAPGMNTSLADMRAVLEAEAQPAKGQRVGTVDAAARKLIERARAIGWRSYNSPADKPGILFDGSGRYVYERTLPIGLLEEVVCDGQTILHLYPQLHLGAKRDVSRFHRGELAALVPWAVGMADDYAHGADVVLVDADTIAIVPHFETVVREWIAQQPKDTKTPEWSRWHLRFGVDGALHERQLVRQPSGKIVVRQILEKNGTIRVVDEKGKELAINKGTLAAMPAPFLTPETKDFVVAELPYRTPETIKSRLKMEKRQLQDLRFAEALPLLTAYVAAGDANEAQNVFRTCFARREQNNLGYYVLLAACGVNLDADHVDVQAEHPDAPLAQYLALHTSPVLRKHASQWAVTSSSWADPMLQHLGTTHAIMQRWQSDKLAKSDKLPAERIKALDYVKKHKDAFGWSLLNLMQERTDREKHKDFFRELAKAYDAFSDHATFAPSARYESARCLHFAGDDMAARTLFLAHFENALKDKRLPALDEDFRRTFAEADRWGELMRGAARDFVKDERRPHVLALAWQASKLEDQPLANVLVEIALTDADAKEKPALTVAAIELLQKANQLVRADELLRTLLADKELTKRPELWNRAIDFADRRDMPARALECLEKTLDAEFAHLPEVIELAPLREKSRRLLREYAKLADAMTTLGVTPAADFHAKVVRAADRWRAVDRESSEACELASAILHRLGERDLAWDYLTTPIAHRPSESAGWLTIATDLGRKGDLALADVAYKSAFEAEPTNAQILWDRAENLTRAGRPLEARTLFQQLTETNWQPRFQGLKSQAKARLP